MAGAYRFGRFVLDPEDRRLTEDGRTVELSGRYLDALVLLVAEQGRLVKKTRFLDEVWKGVPVTDEALTQCVRSLRKALGDEVGRPRFIETAPRHGYRFIAPVMRVEADPPPVAPDMAETAGGGLLKPGATSRARIAAIERCVRMGRAGLVGGGAAGVIGGVVYGVAGVANDAGGALSGLLVLAALTAVIGMLGGAGVGFGAGLAAFAARRPGPFLLLGSAVGGSVVGAAVRLAGLDTFSLLFGSLPTAMTGGGEGLVLGAAIGAGLWIARDKPKRVALLTGAVLTGSAAVVVALLGGRLMGGSLAALAAQFPGARLRLDHIGSLFGEATFGPVSQAATAGLEGALFGSAMVAALSSEWRRSARVPG